MEKWARLSGEVGKITIASAISNVEASVGVAALHLETGKKVLHNADDLFFTASTRKVPMLVELYRQVDSGIIDTQSRVELTNRTRSPGTGVLKEMGDGLNPTIYDLAVLMIVISDNTATDILYDLIGRSNLSKSMQEIGLTSTRIRMSCREFLYSMYGIDTQDIGQAETQLEERAARSQVVRGALGASLDHSNVSSPSDMVHILDMIYRGDVLSQSSRYTVLDILGRQQDKTIIPHYLPKGTKTAHKTGGVTGVRCDVGIVYAPSGPYAIALMAREVTNERGIENQLAKVSEAVYDHFEGSTLISDS